MTDCGRDPGRWESREKISSEVAELTWCGLEFRAAQRSDAAQAGHRRGCRVGVRAGMGDWG